MTNPIRPIKVSTETRGYSSTETMFPEAGFDTSGSITTNVVDGFTLCAVGDLIVSRAILKGPDRGIGELVKILRNADVTFGNMETLIFDARKFKGIPQAEYGGTFHGSLPEVAADLRAMGFNLMSRANNHTFDWGVEGMRATSDLLDANEIVHAGVGENLAEASAARFLETRRGRAALVSFASTFTPMSRAGEPAAEAPGRAGLSPLRLEKRIAVPVEMLEGLARVRDALPGFRRVSSDPTCVVLDGTAYVAGSEAGFVYQPNPKDVSNIVLNVRRGKQYSDFCIATNHGHEPGNWSQQPPNYEQSFARQLLDAGADAYVSHGPHQLRGIEIYKSRPIFYGLGNFFFDDLRTPIGSDMFEAYGKDPRMHTDAEVTADEVFKGYDFDFGFSDRVFYESIIAVSRFERNQLSEIQLFPVELGIEERLANRGIPRRASPASAARILDRLRELSQPFGTDITICNGVGIIHSF